jgi:hypothetical protein
MNHDIDLFNANSVAHTCIAEAVAAARKQIPDVQIKQIKFWDDAIDVDGHLIPFTVKRVEVRHAR